jgi:DNA-directed RNA polymerase sigma subunit (sigma70/sigma32)
MDPTFTSIIRTALNTGLTKAKIEKIIAKSEQIEQKLLELNLRLVHSIALQHQGMGLELDDLVYEGKSL